MKSWRERVVIAIVCAAVGWIHVWTVRSSGDPWKFGLEQRDYYNLLIDGWLDGQLHLKVEVPEALLKIRDPYDPAQRPPGLALHDASFYNGRYYVYFGAAPVLTLMLPFRLWSGIDLPLAVAVLIFVYGAFLTSVALLLALRRRYFPEAGPWTVAMAIMVLGLAGMGPVLLRRPHMWELPIAAGSCFALLALLCVWCSLHPARPALVRALRSRPGDAQGVGALDVNDRRRRAGWFAGAGLFLGLAIASRPTYLIAGPMLAVPLVAWWRGDRRLPWSPLLAALGPLLVIGAAMAWHNHARFGHPLQFGQAYQFSHDYESKMAHFRLTHAPFNLWRYYLSAAEWTGQFPFIRPSVLPPKPPGFGGHDDVYGLLSNLPFYLFAVAVPVAIWRRDGRERRALGAWLLTVAVLFAALAGTLAIFFGSLARYQGDFAPALLLLAAAGWLAAARWLGAVLPGVGARVAVGLGSAAAVFSGAFGVLYSLQLDGLFPERNADGYREVARLFNSPAAAWERWRGRERGPLELVLEVAPAPGGTRTIVAEFGRATGIERVTLVHHEGGRLVIEVESSGVRRVTSSPVAFVPGNRHALRVETGALLPAEEHPAWSGLSTTGTLAVLRRLRVEWDGVAVLEVAPWFGGTGQADALRIADSAGSNSPVRVVSSRRDSAALPALRNRAMASAEEVERHFSSRGQVKLQLVPPAVSAGVREPLLVTGRPGRGDVVGLEYGSGGTARFFLDHWGSPARFSPAVALPPGSPVTVRITSDALRTPSPWWRPRNVTHGELRVEIDGREAWREHVELFVVNPAEVAVGVNPIGGTACGPVFTGALRGLEWGPRPPRAP